MNLAKNSSSSFVSPAAWMLGISFIGFLDATYLTAKHYLGSSLTCVFFTGCETVTTSSFSQIFGVPVSLLGSAYYLTVFISLAFFLDSRSMKVLSFVSYFTILGFLASVYFVAVQVFVLKALCLYCMISATTSTLLFILGMVVLRRRGRALLFPIGIAVVWTALVSFVLAISSSFMP